MKELSLKKNCNTIIALCLVVLLASCSSSDEKDPAVVFTNISSTKTYAFIEDKITLTIEGSGYTDIIIKSNNDKVRITQITSTVFELSASEASNATIYAELKNNTYKETKNITIGFVEHGIQNLKTVEGIKVLADNSDKLVRLLGEPLLKTSSTSGLTEFWSYPSKGLGFIITKSSKIVNSITIYSSNYLITLEDKSKVYYTNYSYDLGNGWKINNLGTTVDAIITKLGAPSEKISSSDPSSTLRTYRFSNENIFITFFANAEDDYFGKTIKSLIIY